MPKDQNGFHADMIMDPPSPVKRLSVGQDYEQIINRIGVFVTRQAEEALKAGDVDKAFDIIVEWYTDVHPAYGELTRDLFTSTTDKRRHVEDLIKDALYMNIPAFLSTIGWENVERWIDKWNAHSTPVTYTSRDYFGDMVERTTPEPFAIGSKYVLRLCKDGEFSSPGVATVSHHGMPTTPPKSTNSASLFKRKPGRQGEDENRNMSDIDPKEQLRHARLMSRSPRSVEKVVVELYHNPNPTAIDRFDISDEELAATDVVAAQFHHLMAIAGVQSYDTLRSEIDPEMLAPDDFIGE